MSFTPFESQVATALTVAAIDIGAKDAATKTARAEVALAVSKAFAQAAIGDIQGAAAALIALVKTTTDPGLALVVQNVTNIFGQFLGTEAAVLAASPVIGGVVDSVLSNVASGMAAAATSYGAK